MAGIKESFGRFVEDIRRDYIPVWKWEIPVQSKKYAPHYYRVLEYCRKSQYLVAAVSIICALVFERSWKLLRLAGYRDGLAIIAMETMAWMFLGYFMGLTRFPANYISLVIIRCFVVLEKEIKPQVKNFEIKVLRESRFNGHWSVLSYTPQDNSTPVESQFRHVFFLLLFLVSAWTATVLTKIDWSNHEKGALISTTAATSTAALLLVTSLSFEAFPEAREPHRLFCEVWILFAVAVFFFDLMFMFQRLRRVARGEIKPAHSLRVHCEIAMFFFALYITQRYIPVFHKGLSVNDLFTKKTVRLVKALVPRDLWYFANTMAAYVYNVGKGVSVKSTEPLK